MSLYGDDGDGLADDPSDREHGDGDGDGDGDEGQDYTECQQCSTFTADDEVEAYESGWVCGHCGGFNEY